MSSAAVRNDEAPALAVEDLVAGYGVDPVSVLEPLADERGTGLIMMRSIPVASLCEHHLLPFTGNAAVAYLPGADGLITGLSKLARLMDVLSRRLQVQDRVWPVAEACSLVGGRHEPGAPVAGASHRFVCVAHDDESRQVLVFVAQPV